MAYWDLVEAEEEREREEETNFLHNRFRRDFLTGVYHTQQKFKGEVYQVKREQGEEKLFFAFY